MNEGEGRGLWRDGWGLPARSVKGRVIKAALSLGPNICISVPQGIFCLGGILVSGRKSMGVSWKHYSMTSRYASFLFVLVDLISLSTEDRAGIRHK